MSVYFGSGFDSRMAAELWAGCRKFRELEIPPLSETHEEDALAVLGHDALRVDDFRIDGVTEGLRKRVVDDVERAALSWRMRFFTFSNTNAAGRWYSRMLAIAKKRLPCFSSSKPCLRPRLSFLETPAMLNGWQGNPAQSTSNARDVGDRNVVNIAVRPFAEVRLIGLLAEFVPVGGENAFRARHARRRFGSRRCRKIDR